jgi:hypothetical protein
MTIEYILWRRRSKGLLVNENEGILLAPSRFLPLILNGFVQGIRPT